jgi:soluble lytic murein transglycosylase-like protein
MRAATIAALLLVTAGTASAEVHLVVRGDGTKIISNIGPGGSGKHRDSKWLAAQHDRRSRYDDMIEESAARWRVDPTLVRAVIQVESDFNPRCLSNKGARGLMQLIPETARRYGVRDIFDPAQNIEGGVHYLADLLAMFRHDLEHALAAYNAGEGAVLKHSGIPPYEETMTYVRRALTVYYGTPYGQATSYAGSRGGRKLGGGFKANAAAVAAVMMPGVRYLGTR